MTRSHIWRLLVCSLSVALLWPVASVAQGCCGPPLSIPSLSRSGSIRVLERGTGWLQLTAFSESAREGFGPSGERQPYDHSGHLSVRSLYLTAAAGLMRGADLSLQIPGHSLRYNDDFSTRVRSGLGDPRIALRVSPLLFSESLQLPVVLRAGVKFPGSRFPVDGSVTPLTEGQRDWEVSMESGWWSHESPIYVVGFFGYRWREENEAIARKPGDERFAFFGVGGSANVFGAELAVEGFSGLPPRILGHETPTERREALQLLPTVGWNIGPGRLDLGGQVPITGRNVPNGQAVRLGYVVAWGLR